VIWKYELYVLRFCFLKYINTETARKFDRIVKQPLPHGVNTVCAATHVYFPTSRSISATDTFPPDSIVYWLALLSTRAFAHWLALLTTRELAHWLALLSTRMLAHWLTLLNTRELGLIFPSDGDKTKEDISSGTNYRFHTTRVLFTGSGP
jgi:hypothetical protein